MTQINGYTLVEPPFKGGMALVYKGFNDHGFSRAFKFVRPDKAANSAKLCQQFLKEIKLQSKLDHHNIVKILDAYTHTEESGKSFAVLEMEWLNGMDLQRYIETKAPNGLNDSEVEKILIQVLDGLEYAHSHNILHLDIKPSNLFRTLDGYIKIIDFGIARVVGENAKIIDGAEKLTKLTETGESTFKGTLAFASPEQQVGGKLGFYSDIYSLGKTLHFLCTGSTDPSVEVKSTKFSAIIEKCTFDAPKKRFQTCEELRHAITTPLTKKCCNCGADIPVSNKFCPNCGAEQMEKKKVVIKCPKCGKEYYNKQQFCTECGTPLAVKPVNKPANWVCNNCGRNWVDPLADNFTHYCPFCGSKNIKKS